MYDRVEINKSIASLLIPDGKFSITFDYKNPSRFAEIKSPSDVFEQFVYPSSLSIRGNQYFMDIGKNYLLHPFYSPNTSWKDVIKEIRTHHFGPLECLKRKYKNDYTFGALFLEKKTT